MTERPNTADLIRAKHSGDRPPWASGLSSAGRAVYLSDLMVLPGRRGAGAATALIRHVHRDLDRAGFDAVVLHYLAVNPLAAPVWHRCGYRPLLTNWGVRPATHLR
jgi:GNAT superfamily N-acetyltransferase